MINDPRWVTTDNKVAHLLTTSHYVGMPHSGEREAWCGVRIDGTKASETETVRRCGGCLRKLNAFSSAALAPIPDRVRETVTIVVERPVAKRVGAQETGEETALELVHRALDRRKAWEVISADQISIESVDVDPVEE